jgi:hypothetical protein
LDPFLGRSPQPSLLVGADGRYRPSMRVPGPGLHLAEHDHASSSDDQIDLTVPARPVSLDHAVAVAAVVESGEPLTP